MKRILVVGAGMVGSAIAADLAEKFSVTAADTDNNKLSDLRSRYNINVVNLDVNNSQFFEELLSQNDIVVNAVPGFLGFNVLSNIIKAGKDVVDISFFGEDAFELSELALNSNVIAVVDCGVAPGLSNIVLGYHNAKDKVKSFTCYVGGLPYERIYPFQYKAPFSPSDVIEEYTRPARIKENGEIVTRPALTEPELINFKRIGTLEAFNSDGLRTLLRTINIPDMKEKTLRYPGHREAIQVLKDAGFFSSKEIRVNGLNIKPVEFSSKLLFDLWKLEEQDDEFTVMQIDIITDKEKISYNLFCERDKVSGFSSMAMTTGFTCTAVVNLLAEGKITQKGIYPPEYIGKDERNFRYVLDYLKKRNVNIERS